MDASTRRQQARRMARERKAKEASQRDRELADLGHRVEIAISTRDAALQRTEQIAGELLTALTREHGISMEAALLWCGGAVARPEALRLRREHERRQADPDS